MLQFYVVCGLTKTYFLAIMQILHDIKVHTVALLCRVNVEVLI